MNIVRRLCAFLVDGPETRTLYVPEVSVEDNTANAVLYGMSIFLIRPYEGCPHYWGSRLLLNKSWSLL
jgi:hypothetical protein